MVFRRRLQILADGQEIDVGGAHVLHHLHHRLFVLAQTDHDPGFGEHRRVKFLDPLQKPQRMEITRAGADFGVKSGNGFKVVVEHVGARFNDDL